MELQRPMLMFLVRGVTTCVSDPDGVCSLYMLSCHTVSGGHPSLLIPKRAL